MSYKRPLTQNDLPESIPFSDDTSVLSSKIELMGEDVIECLQNCNFGIIDIFEDEVGAALEIWVKDLETEAVYMYLLFPYDYGVIEY